MVKHVVVFVDGPNADNQACAWGALNAFDGSDIQLAAVVVSATAVNYRHNAPLGSRDIEVSRRVHRMHTARMAGLFRRAGVGVPVFLGADIADTDITSPIPHSAHVRHEDYDIFADAGGLGARAIAGDFTDALTHLRTLDGEIHIVVGGPFSEIPMLLAESAIADRLGYLAAQAGFALSTRAIYAKLAFNVDVDLGAALHTLMHYPNAIFAVPSDITRHPSVTFRGVEELARLNIHPELAEIFRQHRARAELRHKQEQLRQQANGTFLKPYPGLSIHDLQAVLALRQALGLEDDMFEFAAIDVAQAAGNIEQARRLQERDGFAPTSIPTTLDAYNRVKTCDHIPARYVVTAQDSERYKRQVPELLRPYAAAKMPLV